MSMFQCKWWVATSSSYSSVSPGQSDTERGPSVRMCLPTSQAFLYPVSLPSTSGTTCKCLGPSWRDWEKSTPDHQCRGRRSWKGMDWLSAVAKCPVSFVETKLFGWSSSHSTKSRPAKWFSSFCRGGPTLLVQTAIWTPNIVDCSLVAELFSLFCNPISYFSATHSGLFTLLVRYRTFFPPRLGPFGSWCWCGHFFTNPSLCSISASLSVLWLAPSTSTL